MCIKKRIFAIILLITLQLGSAHSQVIGKCIPSDFQTEKEIFDRHAESLKGRVFRSTNSSELVINVIPNRPIIFTSCSTDGPLRDPGWRVRGYFESTDQVLLIQGRDQFMSEMTLKLVSLKSGQQIELSSPPVFSSDHHFFYTAINYPALMSSSSINDSLQIWSCGESAVECKMIYRFPEPASQIPIVKNTNSEPNQTPVLTHLTAEWSEKRNMSFSSTFRSTVDNQTNFLKYHFSCVCDSLKCNCSKGDPTAIGVCPAAQGSWTDCGYCRAACLKASKNPCSWGAGIILTSIQPQLPNDQQTQRFTCTEEEIRDGESRFALQLAWLVAKAEAKEKARLAEEAESKKQYEAQEKARLAEEAEERLKKANQFLKHLETKPDWFIKEAQIIGETKDRIFRRDSGQELVVKTIEKGELTFKSWLHFCYEEGIFRGSSVKVYFPLTDQVLIEDFSCDCGDGCDFEATLINFKSGKLDTFHGLESIQPSPDKKYFAVLPDRNLEHPPAFAIWSCAVSNLPCKEIYRENLASGWGDFAYGPGPLWPSPNKFVIRDTDGKSLSCECNPNSCTCKKSK